MVEHRICQLSLFLFFVVSSISPECDIGGTWSTWQIGLNQTGFDYYGSCWDVNWVRQCFSAPECPCIGMLTFRSLGVLVRATSKAFQSIRTNSGKVPPKFEDLNSLYPGKSQLDSTSSDNSWLAIPYKDFDVLVSDIDENELIEIGADNGTEHLSIGSFSSSPFPVKGRIHGINLRLMAPLVCRYNGKENSKAFNVWFFANPGSPYTCLTVKSLEMLVGHGFTHSLHTLAIQDPSTKIECHVSKAHFAAVNLLGMNAMQMLELSIDLNWDTETFELIKK